MSVMPKPYQRRSATPDGLRGIAASCGIFYHAMPHPKEFVQTLLPPPIQELAAWADRRRKIVLYHNYPSAIGLAVDLLATVFGVPLSIFGKHVFERGDLRLGLRVARRSIRSS